MRFRSFAKWKSEKVCSVSVYGNVEWIFVKIVIMRWWITRWTVNTKKMPVYTYTKFVYESGRWGRGAWSVERVRDFFRTREKMREYGGEIDVGEVRLEAGLWIFV